MGYSWATLSGAKGYSSGGDIRFKVRQIAPLDAVVLARDLSSLTLTGCAHAGLEDSQPKDGSLTPVKSSPVHLPHPISTLFPHSAL